MLKDIPEFRIVCGNEPIILKPLADVHLGSRNCDLGALRKYLGEPRKDTYILGMGDLLDSIIVADSRRYRRSSDATDPYSDEVVDYQVNKMLEILMPFREQILALTVGNHEDVITKYCGTNPVKRMCQVLDVPYLGMSWLIKLVLARSEKGGVRTVIVRGHHGFGGGSRTQGADITKFAKDMNFFESDIFLYGHVHKLQYDAIERLAVVGKRLVARPRHLCICGTFLKTYSEGTDVTYSEEKGYPPTALGGLDISIGIDSHAWCDIDVSIKRL